MSETDTMTADALRDPYFAERGEIVVGRNGTHAVVIERVEQPAGDIVMGGDTLAESLGVRPERVCVWVVTTSSLAASHREFETPADVVDAVREEALFPTPVATTMIEPADADQLDEIL